MKNQFSNEKTVRLLNLHCDARKNVLIRHRLKCILRPIVEYLRPNQELANLRLYSRTLKILETVEVDVVLQDHIYSIQPLEVTIQIFTLLLFMWNNNHNEYM